MALIPLWLKIAYTLVTAVITIVYLRKYGLPHFLWFSDIALIGAVPAMWLESALLSSVIAVGLGVAGLGGVTGVGVGEDGQAGAQDGAGRGRAAPRREGRSLGETRADRRGREKADATVDGLFLFGD